MPTFGGVKTRAQRTILVFEPDEQFAANLTGCQFSNAGVYTVFRSTRERSPTALHREIARYFDHLMLALVAAPKQGGRVTSAEGAGAGGRGGRSAHRSSHLSDPAAVSGVEQNGEGARPGPTAAGQPPVPGSSSDRWRRTPRCRPSMGSTRRRAISPWAPMRTSSWSTPSGGGL